MSAFKRNKIIDYPSESEFADIMKAEAQRPYPPGKENKHYADLEALKIFLKELKIPFSGLHLNYTWQETLVKRQEFLDKALPAILNANKEDIKNAAIKLYGYLSEEDKPKKANLILVFGAKTPLRAEKAVELYKKGFAPKIMFSGGSPLWATAQPEAEVYKQIALKMGVLEKDIITEPSSVTLLDNVRSSLNLLDKMDLDYKKIILVNSPYAQRRGYGYMQKYVPKGTEIYRVNCGTKEGLRKDDWFANEEGIKYVLTEYGKIWISLVTNIT